jgi:malonyl CoA-acyl carrier protein transacylase
MESVANDRQAQLRRQLDDLTAQLEQAKQIVQQWTDAGVQLSRNVAEKRAENQMRGRTLASAFLGSGYQAHERGAAVYSNARIAQEVAKKRSTIALEKKKAQEVVRSVKSQVVYGEIRTMRSCSGGPRDRRQVVGADVSIFRAPRGTRGVGHVP